MSWNTELHLSLHLITHRILRFWIPSHVGTKQSKVSFLLSCGWSSGILVCSCQLFNNRVFKLIFCVVTLFLYCNIYILSFITNNDMNVLWAIMLWFDLHPVDNKEQSVFPAFFHYRVFPTSFGSLKWCLPSCFQNFLPMFLLVCAMHESIF